VVAPFLRIFPGKEYEQSGTFGGKFPGKALAKSLFSQKNPAADEANKNIGHAGGQLGNQNAATTQPETNSDTNKKDVTIRFQDDRGTSRTYALRRLASRPHASTYPLSPSFHTRGESDRGKEIMEYVSIAVDRNAHGTHQLCCRQQQARDLGTAPGLNSSACAGKSTSGVCPSPQLPALCLFCV
jgi:hypothetical protein